MRNKKNFFFFAGAIVFIVVFVMLVIILMNYRNSIDVNTVNISSNSFFCPIGDELGEEVVIELESASEVFFTEYEISIKSAIVDLFTAKSEVIDLLNIMYETTGSGQRTNSALSIKEIIIPPKAQFMISEQWNHVDENMIGGLEIGSMLMDKDMGIYMLGIRSIYIIQVEKDKRYILSCF